VTDARSGDARSHAVLVLALVLVGAVVVPAAYWLGSRVGESAKDPAGNDAASPSTTSGQPADTGPVVLAISLDGLRPDAITKLGKEGAPNLHRLMAQGASTLNARTAYESTKTLPNHTGMLTGRGVAGKPGHSVTFNNDDGGTLAATHGAYVPGMFDVAHDRGRQTAFFAEKDKFRYLMRSWDGAHGRRDTIGADDGRDKTDIDLVGPAEQIVPAVEAALLDGRTDLIFLHLTAPDRAGHADEWLSSEYYDAVTEDDDFLGDILATVDAHPELAKRLTILVTADHGGEKGETTHYVIDDRQNYQIPFLAWGRGVPHEADLYNLNPRRRDPGDRRPVYTGPQPIRNMDVADVSLRLLGLPPIAGAVSTGWPTLTVSR
jgi:predicted AlkP superfamily pyrophosphatase or phosphodiesterase